MDILREFDGLYAIPIIDLVTKFGLASVGMSAAAIVGSVVQGIRYKKAWPYTYVIVAAICYLVYGAIISTILETPIFFINSIHREPVSHDLFKILMSKIIASGFFLTISASVIWFLLFDTFRATSPNQEGFIIFGVKLVPSLAGTYCGYLCTITHIIIAIVYSSYLGSLKPEPTMFILDPIQHAVIRDSLLPGLPTFASNPSDSTRDTIVDFRRFLAFGLWAFFAPLLVQLSLSLTNFRRIPRTVVLYILFILLVTIGFSIGETKPALISQVRNPVIAYCVLTQVCGILALYVVVLTGHTWIPTASEERHDEENRSKSIDERYALEQKV